MVPADGGFRRQPCWQQLLFAQWAAKQTIHCPRCCCCTGSTAAHATPQWKTLSGSTTEAVQQRQYNRGSAVVLEVHDLPLLVFLLDNRSKVKLHPQRSADCSSTADTLH
jgi:hypothetical protein